MLSDCVRKDPSVCELFIVQKGPAAFTAKRMRDRMTHAVLPISSAILKVIDAPLDVLLDDEQVKQIIATLGVGICLEEDKDAQRNMAYFSLDHLRYGRIIVVTDKTTRGRHIREQIVSFMYRFNYPVLAAGHLYIVPPEPWLGMGDDEFEAKVMSPTTRFISPLRVGKSLAETLGFLRAFDASQIDG